MTQGNGDVPSCEWVFWSPPAKRLMLGEITSWFECVTLVRRRALLFAPEMNLDPLEVIDLTWKAFNRSQLTPFAKRLVAAQAYHIRLPYLLWEYIDEQTAAPLFRLDLSAEEVGQGEGLGVVEGSGAGCDPHRPRCCARTVSISYRQSNSGKRLRSMKARCFDLRIPFQLLPILMAGEDRDFLDCIARLE